MPRLEIKRLARWLQQVRAWHRWGLVGLAASVLLLVGVSSYGAVRAGRYYATVSDALVDTYVVGQGLGREHANVPNQHSNLFKFPLALVEGRVPFHYKAFVLVNILLVTTATLAWCWLLVRLFGREYARLIVLLMAALLFGSALLNYDIAYMSVRNIEFPVALGFVMLMAWLLKTPHLSRRQWWGVGVLAALFVGVLAGDSFFGYAFCLPLLGMLGWHYLQARRWTARMWLVVGLTAGSWLLAQLLKLGLQATGLYTFGTSLDFKSVVVSAEAFGSSIAVATRQLLDIHGADILGLPVQVRQGSAFVALLVLLIGVGGFVLLLRRAAQRFWRGGVLALQDTFVLTVLALSFFATLFIYIFSGQVVRPLANGSWVSSGQERYLSLLPFLTVAGVVWVVKTFYSTHRAMRWGLPLLLLAGMLVSHGPIAAAYAPRDARAAALKQSIVSVADILEREHVHVALTGYWYGPPLSFWSGNRVQYVGVIHCNQQLPFLTRDSWYRIRPGTKTALVVDRGWSEEYEFWNCTDTDLQRMYGPPQRIIPATGYQGSNVRVWIYNTDARAHIIPAHPN